MTGPTRRELRTGAVPAVAAPPPAASSGAPVAPEVARWLAVPVVAGARVVVAGVAGGVGTTTVAVLLHRALGGALLDHAGGQVQARAGGGGRVVDPAFVVHDAGPHALTQDVDLLAEAAAAVVVCGGHVHGLARAGAALAALRAAHPDAHRRAVVVPVGGRAGARSLTAAARGVPALADVAVAPVRRWHELTGPGPVPAGSRADADARALAAHVVRAARWASVVG